MSNSVRPHRRQPTRLPIPGILQARTLEWAAISFSNAWKWKVKVKSESEVAQSCPTLSDPMDCSLTVSSVHGIFWARVLEWGAIAFSAGMHGFPLLGSGIRCPESSSLAGLYEMEIRCFYKLLDWMLREISPLLQAVPCVFSLYPKGILILATSRVGQGRSSSVSITWEPARNAEPGPTLTY